MIREVLQEIIGSQSNLNGEAIRNFIGNQFNIRVEELKSRSRKRSVAFPRQVGMYLTRKFTDISLAEIGDLYNRDHSTVLHAIRVVTRDMTRNSSTKEQIEILSNKLQNR